MKDSAVTKPNDNQCGEGLRESIAEAAGEFARNQLGIYPGSIFVDHHGASLTITLKKVLAGSEKYAIRDKRAAALIARTLSEAFRAVAGILKAKIGGIVGGNVTEASLVLDASTNRVSIFLETEEAHDR